MAASIISSNYKDTRVAGKGGLLQGEHLFDDGVSVAILMHIADGENAAVRIAAHKAREEAQRIEDEIRRNIAEVTSKGSEATPKLKASTAAQNFAALREAYLSATRLNVIMIGDYLSTLTNGQLQTAFGMTAGQVTTLRANKLTPAASAAASIRAAVGQ